VIGILPPAGPASVAQELMFVVRQHRTGNVAISSQLILTSTTYPKTKPARKHFGKPARMAVVLQYGG
jgi:hypothetical protein